MDKQKKAIITDVDQVLLDYLGRLRDFVNDTLPLEARVTSRPKEWALEEWTNLSTEQCKAVLRDFGQHYKFGTLDAFPGAHIVLPRLALGGYKIIAVTSCGASDITKALRKANLWHCFGDIFEEIIFLDLGGDKEHVLNRLNMQYDVHLFVDDAPFNIKAALNVFDDDIVKIMKAPHNKEYRDQIKSPDMEVYTWYDIEMYLENK